MGYRDAMKKYLHRPRPAVAIRTQWYGSGRVAFKRGDALALVVGVNGIHYVYNADATQANVERGVGLLYTYDSKDKAIRYVEER